MEQRSHEILIIGAGAAGLAAAAELALHGKDVAIVEARDRIGGRIYTIHEHGFPVELGAEFLHGLAPELQHVIDNSSLRTVDASGEHWYLRGREVSWSEEFFTDIERIFAAMNEFVEHTDEKSEKSTLTDASFSEFAEQYLKEHPGERRALAAANRYVEGFNAADANDVSIRWLLQEEASSEKIDGDRQRRFVDGYDGLVNYYAQLLAQRGVPVYLNTPVSRIEWDKEPIVISTAGGDMRFTAGRCLVTVPIAILKSETALKFAPALKQKHEAIAAIAAGQVRRSSFIFSHPFWEHMELNRGDEAMNLADAGFFHAEGVAFPTWWTQQPMNCPMLVAWAGGPAASHLQTKSRDDLLRIGLQCLSQILPATEAELRRNLVDFYSYDWQNDPFTRCAYSYIKEGGLHAPKQLAEPMDGKLFFAGEATDYQGFSGTVHGAIRSGLRAADQIKRRANGSERKSA